VTNGCWPASSQTSFQTLNNANARLLLLLLLFLLVADAEIADAWAPPHSTRLLLFSLSLLRPPGLRSFFGFLFVRLFLIAHQIDFDSLLIRSRILTHLFSFFSLLSKNKTKHKFRNFPCVCFGFGFIFFCLAASAILFLI
jgi:hypothetical protein